MTVAKSRTTKERLSNRPSKRAKRFSLSEMQRVPGQREFLRWRFTQIVIAVFVISAVLAVLGAPAADRLVVASAFSAISARVYWTKKHGARFGPVRSSGNDKRILLAAAFGVVVVVGLYVLVYAI